MADTSLIRGKTLPNSGVKNDLHELIDLSTVSIANIVDADIKSNAAIAGSKIDPNFGAQDLIAGTGTFSDAVEMDSTLVVSGAVSIGGALTASSGLAYAVGMGAYDTDDANQVGGSSTTLAMNTEYQANVDGHVVVETTFTNDAGYLQGEVGLTSGSRFVVTGECSGASAIQTGTSFPVAKNEYWYVTGASFSSTTVRFKPIS